MSLQAIDTLSYFKSYIADRYLEAKPLDISFLQLDEDCSISSKEIEMLPSSYKSRVKYIFSKILSKKEVLEDVKKEDATSICIKVQGHKLVYSLDGKTKIKTLQDKKIQKAFEKTLKNIKKYLLDTKDLQKRKIVDISEADKKIIKSRPKNVAKIKFDEKLLEGKSKVSEYFKKVKKYDPEWSLWAIFFSDLHSIVAKSFKFLGLSYKFLDTIKYWDEWLGTIVGFFGVINGLEDVKDARKIDDKEGKYDGVHKIIRNTLMMFASTIDWIGEIIKTVGHVFVKLAFSFIATALFLFVTLYAMARYIYFDIKAINFKNKFNEYLNNPNLSDEEKRIGILNFLKRKLKVSKRQSLKIIKTIRAENPNLSDEQIQKLANAQIKKLVLTKAQRFERRVGENVIGLIQRNVKDITNNPKDEKSVEKADKIIKKVRDKNWFSIHDNTGIVIAIAFQAIELLFFIIMGGITPTALVMGILSSVIFTYIGGYSLIRTYYLKEDKEEKEEAKKEIDLLEQNAV